MPGEKPTRPREPPLPATRRRPRHERPRTGLVAPRAPAAGGRPNPTVSATLVRVDRRRDVARADLAVARSEERRELAPAFPLSQPHAAASRRSDDPGPTSARARPASLARA